VAIQATHDRAFKQLRDFLARHLSARELYVAVNNVAGVDGSEEARPRPERVSKDGAIRNSPRKERLDG